MANIRPVIVPAKALKGGKHKIRISVSHNGQTRYIVTNIIIDSVKEFSNGSIIKRSDAAYLNTQLRKTLQQYQNVLDDLPFASSLSCSELVSNILNYGSDRHKSVKEIYEEFLDFGRIKKSSLLTYRTYYRRIISVIPCDTLIESITPAMVLKLDRELEKRRMSPYTIKLTMSFLVQLLKFARKSMYEVPKFNPFASYKMPSASIRCCWLTVEEVKHLRDLHIENRYVKKTRDMIMLSYYLGGINMVDMLKINFAQCGGTINYIRTKTETRNKRSVIFTIPEEAYPLIKSFIGDDGYLHITKHNLFQGFLTNHVPALRVEADLPQLVYYSARKSFAQHAFQLGVSEGVIDYILGHKVGKSGSSLYNYISVTPEQATKAVRLVLDNLKK